MSFASKHMRLLFAGRYGLLDQVICTGLGFALDRAGFVLFFGRYMRSSGSTRVV